MTQKAHFSVLLSYPWESAICRAQTITTKLTAKFIQRYWHDDRPRLSKFLALLIDAEPTCEHSDKKWADNNGSLLPS